MSRQSKNPDIRKQEIINTAFQLFLDKGYDKTSMLDISKKMGVSQGLCYRYFKSKEEIYDIAIEQYINDGYILFHNLITDKSKNIIEKIEDIPWISHIQQNSNILHQYYNHSKNQNFHDQINLALCLRLAPVLTRELEIAKDNGDISINNINAVAYYCLFGQMGLWLNGNLSYEEKVKETKRLTRLCLGL